LKSFYINKIVIFQKEIPKQLIAIKMSLYLSTFKGITINYPYHTSKDKFFELFDKLVEEIKKIASVEDVYLEMKKVEGLILENRVNGEITQFVLEKVSKIMKLELSVFITSWFANINFLIKHKYKNAELSADDYGFVIGFPNTEEENTLEKTMKLAKSFRKDFKKDKKICGVCAEPAEKLCVICKSIYYCCREHQKQDWKRHKKECGDT
jgi:hypothetical protein